MHLLIQVGVISMISLANIINHNSPFVQQQNLIKKFRSFAFSHYTDELKVNNLVSWVLRYTQFHNSQHPSNLNKRDLEAFVSHLASERHYPASIQQKAIEALEFLYKDFLKIDLGSINYQKINLRRGYADRFGKKLCLEVAQHMQATSSLMFKLAIYSNLKLREVVAIKIKDIDVKKNTIQISKPRSDYKFTINIPVAIILELRIQLLRSRQFALLNQEGKINQSQLNLIDSISKKSNHSYKDCYLFSIASLANPIASTKKQILSILKNDIKVASRIYSRTSVKHSTKSVNIYPQRLVKNEAYLDCAQSSFTFATSKNYTPLLKQGAA